MKSSGGCDLRLCMSALCLAGLAAPALFGDSVSLADLAPLLGTNLYSSQASSINDEGDVVGTAYYGSTGSTYYTFFYSGTGQQPQMTIINSLYSNTPGLAGAGDSQPTGLGATGEVSGVVYNSSHVARAFLYENKDLTDLGTLGAANNGSFGYGVNDSGMVVGGSFVDSSVENVFSDSGAMANLQKPTGAFSAYGQFVDDSGQIVGYSNASGGQAFFYDPTDQIYTTIALPSGGSSTATAMSPSGQVAGQAQGTVYQQAFVFNPTTLVTTDIGTTWSTSHNNPPGASIATAINDVGEIVGQADVASGQNDAVVFTDSDTGYVMTDLGTLNGREDSSAIAVNHSGWIVGSSYDVTGISQTQTNLDFFLYVPGGPDGQMIDLGALAAAQGWQLLSVTGINKSGAIVGEGINNNNSTPTTDAFIMNYSTAPEPSTLVSLASGLLLFAAGVRRSRQRSKRD